MKTYIRHIPTALLINSPLALYVVLRFDQGFVPVAPDSIVFIILSSVILSISFAATLWIVRLIHSEMHPLSKPSHTLDGHYISREQHVHFQGV
ncbi:MAG: hypothetical protein U1E36_00900 [Rickettsiales bacterium]